jgi:mannose-6-phosphate isomerase
MTKPDSPPTSQTPPGDGVGEIKTRPWGHYEVLAEDATAKLKRIVVRPGGRLSLQRHQRRREHWYVVEGVAQVELAGELMTLRAGQSVDIPLHAWHRLANTAEQPLALIEIQCGDYFGEDDIERIADDYGRAGSV